MLQRQVFWFYSAQSGYGAQGSELLEVYHYDLVTVFCTNRYSLCTMYRRLGSKWYPSSVLKDVTCYRYVYYVFANLQLPVRHLILKF